MSLPDVLAYQQADKPIHQAGATIESCKEAPMHSRAYKFEKRRAALLIALSGVIAVAIQLIR